MNAPTIADRSTMVLRHSIICLTALLFCFTSRGQVVPFSFVGFDPCSGTPARGVTCKGGALYAGVFDGGKYMVTPMGCTDSPTPVCDGGAGTIRKGWNGSSGSMVDIGTLSNVASAATASSSSYRGHVNTPLIVADASISSDSAADFCNNMDYGGYIDWYLPSKSELAYLYCHANDGHNVSNPQEDPDCTSYGGKTTELGTFDVWPHWSSTQISNNQAWKIRMSDGAFVAFGKGSLEAVRCIRRY